MKLKSNAAEGHSAAHLRDAGMASVVTAHYSTDQVQRTLQEIDLVDLVQKAGASLQKSGQGLRSACPLHKGRNKTAFSVFTDDAGIQRWHCHTDCNAGGDAIEFVKRWRGMDFKEALQWLAEEYHLDLELGTGSISPEFQQRREIMDKSMAFFSGQLWSSIGKEAREFLYKRGFTEKTLREAGWGFSQTDDALLQALTRDGVDVHLARELGLLRRDGLDFTANANGKAASPGGYIIFPHVLGGRAVFFSARAVTPMDPKDKSRNLPGSRQLYWALKSTDPNLVIVEGQADAESLRQVGFSAVALCGLGSIPEEDVMRIQKRRNVFLALDQDQGADEDQAAQIQKRRMEVMERVCADVGPLCMIIQELPYKDINEWLQNGLTASRWQSQMKQAISWVELRIRQFPHVPLPEQDQTLRALLEMIQTLPDTQKSIMLSHLKTASGLGLRDLKQWMKSAQDGNGMEMMSEIRNGGLYFKGEALGNFWARITNEQSLDDGINPLKVRYRIEGGLEGGNPLQPVFVDAVELAKMDWVSSNWGMRVIQYLAPKNRYIMARAIQEVSMEEVVRERLFTYTGWVEMDGKRGYLTSSGLLTEQGLDESVRVDLGNNNLRHYALCEPPQNAADRQAAADATLSFLKLGPRTVTAPLWAAIFASPLTSLRSLNTVVNVYGTTQSGKSTLSHLALTHFGKGFIKGRDYNAPIDWMATITSIEGGMFITKDAAFIIDDFAPQFASAHDAKDMHKKAGQVVRSVGNRSARSRSRADLSQQTTRFPRGLVVMTSENPLVGQSVVGRMLYVPMSPGDVLPAGSGKSGRGYDAINHLQEIAQQGILAGAMSLYIQYLARHWDRVAVEFPQMVDAASETFRMTYQVQNRLPDTYGVLDAAQTLAVRAFVEMGLLNATLAEQIIGDNSKALVDLVTRQADRVAEESPIRKVFEALSNLLVEKKIYFAPRTQMENFVAPDRAELVGYFDPGNSSILYLRTEACLTAAKTFWRGLDQHLDIMPDALRRQVQQTPNLLAERDARQVEVLKHCGGFNVRVLAIHPEVVEALYGISLTTLQ
jgi:DNA primase catalytic core